MKEYNERQLRKAVVKALDAIEDLMIITGSRETDTQRSIWRACAPLWFALQKELRRLKQ